MENNSLLDLVQKPKSNSLLDLVQAPQEAKPQFDMNTALGRRDFEQDNIRQNIEKLKAIKPQTDNIKGMIAHLESQLPGNFTTGDRGLSEFQAGVSGASSGAIKGALLAVPEAVVNIGKLAHIPGASAAAAQFDEANAAIDEELPTQGKVGGVANFAGQVVGGGPAFGEVIGKSAGVIAGKSARAAALFERAAAPGAKVGTRVAARVVEGLPLQTGFALGAKIQDVPDDATPEESAKIREDNAKTMLHQFALGVAMDAVFGALPPLKKKVVAEALAGDHQAKSQVSPERLKKLQETIEKKEASEAAAEQLKVAKRQSQAEWQHNNPETDWKDLDKDAQAKVLENYVKARYPTLDTSPDGQLSLEIGGNKAPVPKPTAAVPSGVASQGELPLKSPAQDMTEMQQSVDASAALHPDIARVHDAVVARNPVEWDNIGIAAGSGLRYEELNPRLHKVITPEEYAIVEQQVEMQNKATATNDTPITSIDAKQGTEIQSYIEQIKDMIVKYTGMSRDEAHAQTSDFMRREIANGVSAEEILSRVKYEVADLQKMGNEDVTKIQQALRDFGEQGYDTSKFGGDAIPIEMPPARTYPEPIQKIVDAIRVETAKVGDPAFIKEADAEIAYWAGRGDEVKLNETLEKIRTENEIAAMGDEPPPEIAADLPPVVKEPLAAELPYMTILDSSGSPAQVLNKAQLAIVDNHHSLAFNPETLSKESEGALIFTRDGDTIVQLGSKSKLTDAQVIEGTQKAGLPVDNITLIKQNNNPKIADEVRVITGDKLAETDHHGVKISDLHGAPYESPGSVWWDALNPVERQQALDAAGIKSKIDTNKTFDYLTNNEGASVEQAHSQKPLATTMPEAPLPTPSGTPLVSESVVPVTPRGAEAPSISSVKKLPEETFLETLKHTNPLEELSDSKINKALDKVLEKIQEARPNTLAHDRLTSDVDKLMTEQARRNSLSPADKPSEFAKPPEGAIISPEATIGMAPEVVGGARIVTKAEAPFESLDPKIARKLFQAKLKSMSNSDLELHIADMEDRMQALGKDEAAPYRKRLDEALAERAERFKSGGFKAQIPPSVSGAVLGYAVGYFTGDSEDRTTNAWIGAAIGAGVGMGVGRYSQRGTAAAIAKPRTPNELPGGAWQAEVNKHIITGYKDEKVPVPFLEKMRVIYTGLARRSFAAERFMSNLGASKLPTQRNAAKLMSIFGRWQGQTEAALKYGPAIFDEFGDYKKLDALGVGEIIALVKGDTESLDALMAARTVIEQGSAIKTPIDPVAALQTFHAMPENFHVAADEARKYSLAMVDVLVDGGVTSKASRELLANETFYSALQRVFKFSPEGVVSAEKTGKEIAGAVNPMKARTGGSEASIKSPFETMIATTPQFFRAAELNKIKYLIVDTWEAAGSPTELLKRASKAEHPDSPLHDAQIAALKAEIDGLSSSDAEALVAGLNPDIINPKEGIFKVFRNGVIETYKAPKELAQAMLTLNPEEMHMMTKIIGVPARVASKGITYNPYFLGKMAFMDSWQATLNSQYGFRFGVDNIRGWYHIVTDSKKYQEFLGVGGSHQSLLGANKSAIDTALDVVKRTQGSSLEIVVKQIKDMHPIEAYKTLVSTLGDAARIGEYLRGLDHGASTIDAVFAAKNITANYSEIGAFSQMRALNHIVMFMNPAIQVMDQALYRSGLHPFRAPEEGRLNRVAAYSIKAFMTIALPSYYFWHANQGDEKIKQLRQTTGGTKFWFTRINGKIVKIPKPILDGQIWGTSVETALDKLAGDPNANYGRMAEAVSRDAAFNIVPQIGIMPFSLQANQDLGLGSPIIPLADDKLALEHQGEDNATWLSRFISSKVAPTVDANSESKTLRNAVTPAGLDYIFRSVGGMLGQDAVLAVSQSVEAYTKGIVPAKEELPLLKQVLVDYPTTRVQPVEDFYKRLAKVQRVGATINHLATEDPERLVAYMESNIKDYQLVGTFAKTQSTISNYRRAIQDIKVMNSSEISTADRRLIIKEFTSLIIEQAQIATELAKDIDIQ